ncbi:expressed unknown protein [Seminavis robusta]|uniref:Uncharacterized protein n=1 Tax=Seminavis robusta TaxID=568900 RepID=A0A9N8DUN5_9STRA|nr:expressed unknown protein [Seminavis robusta]|eukprot:Sro261_g101820.1 n/a (154) ;mRNA; r:60063-60524
MNKLLLSLALLSAACLAPRADAFVSPQVVVGKNTALFSSSPEEQPEEKPEGLILDASAVQEQMGKLRSKYPTSEADYLAAARKRAEMKVESQNSASTAEDWKKVAMEKEKQPGGRSDDWEASKAEAGNEDSQILIPVDLSGEGGEEEEPKLLL